MPDPVYYAFSDPGEWDVGERITIMTREEAVAVQRRVAASCRPDFVYESDDQALGDFIVVNWASTAAQFLLNTQPLRECAQRLKALAERDDCPSELKQLIREAIS